MTKFLDMLIPGEGIDLNLHHRFKFTCVLFTVPFLVTSSNWSHPPPLPSFAFVIYLTVDGV